MDSSAATVVDIGVAAVLLISAFLAYSRGFVHEVLSVGGWVGATFAAIYGFPYVKPYAREYIETVLFADIAAGAILFILSLVILSLITRGISSRVKDSSLNELDRSLGFLFGIARGAILVCLVYIAAEWLIPAPKPVETESATTGQTTPEAKPAPQTGTTGGQGKSEKTPKGLDQFQWLHEARSMPLIKAGAEILFSLVPSDNAKAATKKRDEVQELYEEQKKIRSLLTPKPKSDTSDPREGYDRKERSDMERLIESNK
ncbi:MAG: CvpA family protein [Rhodospirillales bacterium]|nr:CvpA family protein [Rhodospirillales bacterium]